MDKDEIEVKQSKNVSNMSIFFTLRKPSKINKRMKKNHLSTEFADIQIYRGHENVCFAINATPKQ